MRFVARLIASLILCYALALQGALAAHAAARMADMRAAELCSGARALGAPSAPLPLGDDASACDCSALCAQGAAAAPAPERSFTPRVARILDVPSAPNSLRVDARRPGDPRAARAPPLVDRV